MSYETENYLVTGTGIRLVMPSVLAVNDGGNFNLQQFDGEGVSTLHQFGDGSGINRTGISGIGVWSMTHEEEEEYGFVPPLPPKENVHSMNFSICYNTPAICFDGVLQFSVQNGRVLFGVNYRSREWYDGDADGSTMTWSLEYYGASDNYLGSSDEFEVQSTTDGTATETHYMEADLGEEPPEGTKFVWLYAGDSFYGFSAVVVYNDFTDYPIQVFGDESIPREYPRVPVLREVFDDPSVFYVSTSTAGALYLEGIATMSQFNGPVSGGKIDLDTMMRSVSWSGDGISISGLTPRAFDGTDGFIDFISSRYAFRLESGLGSTSLIYDDGRTVGNDPPYDIPSGTKLIWITQRAPDFGIDYLGCVRLSELQ